MPRGMSEDVSAVIVTALSKGLSRRQISTVVGVSKRAITRINTNLKKHGTARAPPTGVKLGRPARMSPRQAQAMFAWAAGRGYAFHVKDLVEFLREVEGYEGCDGTVRRELVRAGFRKKLPWHKSEITSWIPPEQVVCASDVAAIAQQQGAQIGVVPIDINSLQCQSSQFKTKVEKVKSVSSVTPYHYQTQQAISTKEHHGSEQQHHFHQPIDPALHTPFAHSVYLPRSPTPTLQHIHSHTPSPTHSHATPQSLSHSITMTSTAHQTAVAVPRDDLGNMLPASNEPMGDDMSVPLEHQLSSLVDEVARQRDMIEQLQNMLAQAQAQGVQTTPMRLIPVIENGHNHAHFNNTHPANGG